MIYLFCGSDTLTSRKQYRDFIEKEQKKGVNMLSIEPSNAGEHILSMSHTSMLFAPSCVYLTENLNKLLGRKSTKKIKNQLLDHYISISSSSDEIWIIWEGEPARNLKLAEHSKVYESKIPSTIFTLQNNLFPRNKVNFLKTLQQLTDQLDEYFIFLMLVRHVRNLVLAKCNGLETSLSPWQKSSLIKQSSQWDQTKLEGLYDTLSKIDFKFKTGRTPFSVLQSIEIMSCYYL